MKTTTDSGSAFLPRRFPQRQYNSGNAGVTMVELMVIIAVAAILAVVAIPNLGRMMARIRLRNSANEVASTLKMANSRAVANPRVHCGVYFDLNSQELTVFFDDDGNNQFDSGSDRIYQNAISLDRSTTFSLTTITDNVVIFRGDGSAKNGAVIEVEDSKYNQSKTITVIKQSGKVQIQ
ncbi:MAG: hypothetical protein GF350_01645 [Chitinivibrionales bacterium]|nr:hypothetical protein [Chitinivibrionales bacterium]